MTLNISPAVLKDLKSKKMRSPAYPGINLEVALKRASGLYVKERRNAVAFPVAVSYWGFGPKSSGGLVSVAALKSFGLLDDVERGPGGLSVKLSDLGRASLPPKGSLAEQELRNKRLSDWRGHPERHKKTNRLPEPNQRFVPGG